MVSSLTSFFMEIHSVGFMISIEAKKVSYGKRFQKLHYYNINMQNMRIGCIIAKNIIYFVYKHIKIAKNEFFVEGELPIFSFFPMTNDDVANHAVSSHRFWQHLSTFLFHFFFLCRFRYPKQKEIGQENCSEARLGSSSS